ncbi:unnamed protein product [Vicia faba]|uniref:non-specific serine/threonine protein kinase n=1 Tax=Vicia faba TaxID=3906 RepID=A0AAV0ZG62_VICFA|nr:unnamed protein product [Vicia faba]
MDKNIPMNITIQYTSFFFYLLFIISTFSPQVSYSQSVYDYSICKEHSYNCGNLSSISYPFWGHDRPFQCGAGAPFYLDCGHKQDTTILISSQNFTVLEINTTTYTMKLKRTDLSLNLCSPQFNDTFLSLPLFQIQHLPQFKNLNIYYNCTSPPIPSEDSLCGSQNLAFAQLADDDSNLFEESMNCTRRIQVPVGAGFHIDDSYGYSYFFKPDVLEKGLDEGFEVSYSVSGECLTCLGNQGGDCSWKDDNEIEKHVTSSCYYGNCPDGSMNYSSQCSSIHKSSWNLKRKLVVGVVGSAVMVALLTCIIICYIKGKSSTQQLKFGFKRKNDKNIEAFFKEHGALTQKEYTFAQIKKMTNSFKIKLGQGGFGVVYKGNLFNGCPVAVKILNASKRNGEEFINEGIARGLEYLHRGCTTRILHFDIKPHNILLDENFNPKISDFGLAKLCPRKESIISMSDQRGTMGYVAPEVWNRHFGGVSHKSDVYGYGMMLLEMVGGRKNINADASNTSEIYFPHWVYSRLEFGSDLRPDGVMDTEEDEIARRMTIVGLWCIQTFPNDRPTMSKVVEMLEVSINSLNIPPKPLLSSPTRSVSEP